MDIKYVEVPIRVKPHKEYLDMKGVESLWEQITTGRKLAVDFYGGNCVIGGGSPWTKDGTKADLSLNLLARARAVSYIIIIPIYPRTE